MSIYKDVKSSIEELSTLKSLVQAYEEIASMRMKNTRDSVLKNRKFINELNEIFEEVRISYIEELREMASKRKAKDGTITLLSHNGKTVAVFLSASVGLFGDIISKTFELFAEEVRKGEVEAAIVGRYGLNLFQAEFPNTPYTYFELADSGFKSEDLDQIIKHVVQYEEIHVYYGSFVNVIRQTPEMLVVSAEIDISEKREGEKKGYIFEPSLEEILMFFETQIFASLFDQTVRESQLAKYASRFMAMNRAEENIRRSLKDLRLNAMRFAHNKRNKDQINSLVPIYSHKRLINSHRLKAGGELSQVKDSA